MGYAHTVDDLARGPELTELHTGDLARRGPDGLWEITGRLNRNAKVFGLRLDLERIEHELAGAGLPARMVAVGDTLHAFVERLRLTRAVHSRVIGLTGLPPGAVRVHRVEAFPLSSAGKCDYAALASHAESVARTAAADERDSHSVGSLRDLFAVALGRPDASPADSFVSLGGDSLSFVEVSTQLGQRLGHLPSQWPTLPIAELAAMRPRRHRFTTPVDVSIVLRALALLMILVTHTDLAMIPGGAHILLAVTGYNLARFALAGRGGSRARHLLTALAAVAVPASLWIAGCVLVTGDYRPTTALFLNSVVGSPGWTPDWQFWFLEALVWAYVGIAVLLAVPPVARSQRRQPFAVAMAAVLATLALRYALVGVRAEGNEKYTVAVVLWAVALGWAASEARTRGQRVIVAVAAAVAVAGFFGDGQRELLVAGAVVLLLRSRPVLLPRVLVPALGTVAGASLWIYLTHWQVYPPLEDAGHAPTAILASLVVGVAAARAYAQATRGGTLAWRRLVAAHSQATPSPIEPVEITPPYPRPGLDKLDRRGS